MTVRIHENSERAAACAKWEEEGRNKDAPHLADVKADGR